MNELSVFACVDERTQRVIYVYIYVCMYVCMYVSVHVSGFMCKCAGKCVWGFDPCKTLIFIP